MKGANSANGMISLRIDVKLCEWDATFLKGANSANGMTSLRIDVKLCEWDATFLKGANSANGMKSLRIDVKLCELYTHDHRVYNDIIRFAAAIKYSLRW